MIKMPEKPNYTAEYWLPPSIMTYVETSTIAKEGEPTTSCNPQFNRVKVNLGGEWDRLGLFPDDLDTMAMDMEIALNKIISKYIAFNKSMKRN